MKDRPGAIVLVLLRDGDAPIVRVLPVTHSAPADAADALEIPLPTKQRLGLDSSRSWVVLTEANDFVWPGPDLRAAISGDLSSVAYGMLPPGFIKTLRERLTDRWRKAGSKAVSRTE
ncbi:MAG: hypothetical protein FJX45_09125 [Alphaproteobacteria bacterium]|nr:hypothetical protein [Alphaproteobacteria bacterium]MBM3651436.1 hypothetical protein [Alphaproteobacteria bacterium]